MKSIKSLDITIMKTRPKYHKLGLYGGAPMTPPPTIDGVDGTASTTEDEHTMATESDITDANVAAAAAAVLHDDEDMVSEVKFSTAMTDETEKLASSNENTSAIYGESANPDADPMDVDCIDYDPSGGIDDNQSALPHHESDTLNQQGASTTPASNSDINNSINTPASGIGSIVAATTPTGDEGVKVVFSNKLSVIKAIGPNDGGAEASASTAMDTSHIDTLVSTALSEPILKTVSDALPTKQTPILQKGGIIHKRTRDSESSDPNGTLNDNPSEVWHTVGIFKDLTHKVTNYIDAKEWTPSMVDQLITANNLPDLTGLPRINLEPGTAYRFRLRAINSCGMGGAGEPASFKTCLPGFPGAPSSIKISKSPNGAHLTWEPPPSTQGEILEYTVYLAIKSPGKQKNQTPPSQLAFVRVYSGSNNQCTVLNSSLSSAHVDYTSKPAIIFRIAARNSKGYGPATQVRWLQDASVKVGSGIGSPALAMAGGGGGSGGNTPTGKGIKRKL